MHHWGKRLNPIAIPDIPNKEIIIWVFKPNLIKLKGNLASELFPPLMKDNVRMIRDMIAHLLRMDHPKSLINLFMQEKVVELLSNISIPGSAIIPSWSERGREDINKIAIKNKLLDSVSQCIHPS